MQEFLQNEQLFYPISQYTIFNRTLIILDGNSTLIMFETVTLGNHMCHLISPKTFFSHDITHCLRDHSANVNWYQVLEAGLFKSYARTFYCLRNTWSTAFCRRVVILDYNQVAVAVHVEINTIYVTFKVISDVKTDSLMYWETLFENNLSFDRTYVEEFRNIVCFQMMEIWKQFKLFYLQKYIFCLLIYLCPQAWEEMIDINFQYFIFS